MWSFRCSLLLERPLLRLLDLVLALLKNTSPLILLLHLGLGRGTRVLEQQPPQVLERVWRLERHEAEQDADLKVKTVERQHAVSLVRQADADAAHVRGAEQALVLRVSWVVKDDPAGFVFSVTFARMSDAFPL